MNPLAAPKCRAVRSGGVAAAMTVIAAAGHVLGGGGLPDPAVLVVASALVGSILNGYAKNSFRADMLFASMVAGQLGFHVLFELGSHHMSDTSPTSLVMMVGFHLLAALVCSVAIAGFDQTLFLLAAPLRAARLLLTLPTDPVRQGRPPLSRVVDVVVRHRPGDTPGRRRGPPRVAQLPLLTR